MMNQNDHTRYRYGLIILVILGFMFWGGRSLWDSSEARYGQVAFEMLANGNWLVPSLAGQPHLTKPPFTYWMIAAGMKIFGINAWGARFFLAIFFTATLFCVRELASTLGYDRKAALSSAFIFATAIVPFFGGHTLTTDAFLTFWETLGILAAWKVWRNPDHRSTYWRMVFWAAFGMAFFTKGPPALLPLVAIGVFVWMRRGRGLGSALLSLPGIVLFTGISLWWFAVLVVRDPSLLHYFIGDEVIGRIASGMHGRNDPFWIYAPVIIFGAGPWMLLWPRLAARVYNRVRQKTLLAEDCYLFLLIWFVVPLCVFLLAESRMPLYVMPLFVPLALAMAAVWHADVIPWLHRSPAKRRATFIGLSVWILLLTGFTVYPDGFPGSRSHRPAAEVFDRALVRMEEPIRLCWVFAGRQKYSIPFYMQRVVTDVDDFDLPTGSQTLPEIGSRSRILYITRARLLPVFLDRPHPPVVLAKAQQLALIEWPRTAAMPKEAAKPPQAGDRSTGGVDIDAGRFRFHTAHQKGMYATLLLVLAESRP